jgi:hypothetical protein
VFNSQQYCKSRDREYRLKPGLRKKQQSPINVDIVQFNFHASFVAYRDIFKSNIQLDIVGLHFITILHLAISLVTKFVIK